MEEVSMYDTNLQNWSNAVTVSVNNVLNRLVNFLPNLIGAILILIVGWLVALLLEQIVDRVLRMINLPRLFERARVEDLVKRTGSRRDTVGLLAGLVKWIVYLATFLAAADVLQLEGVTDFLNRALAYTPNVIAGVAIILVGGILAQFLAEVVRGAVSAANLGYAAFLGGVTRWSIWIFAILTALFQLGVASAIIQTLFTGLVAALAIAAGLAFGLGGQKTAADVLEKVRKDFE